MIVGSCVTSCPSAWSTGVAAESPTWPTDVQLDMIRMRLTTAPNKVAQQRVHSPLASAKRTEVGPCYPPTCFADDRPSCGTIPAPVVGTPGR